MGLGGRLQNSPITNASMKHSDYYTNILQELKKRVQFSSYLPGLQISLFPCPSSSAVLVSSMSSAHTLSTSTTVILACLLTSTPQSSQTTTFSAESLAATMTTESLHF